MTRWIHFAGPLPAAGLTALALVPPAFSPSFAEPSASGPARQTKAAAPALRRQVHHAMDRGLRLLMDGPITDLATRGRGKKSGRKRDGLCLYAALHAGASRYEKRIQAASDALAQQKIRRTYEAACAIMALERSDGEAYRSSIEELAGFLAKTQVDGAWGYPGSVDLSNTQYAAFGLWTAQRGGISVKRGVWEDLAAALPDFATPDGGFCYGRRGRKATVSMTAAGTACASICLQALALESGSEAGSNEGAFHELTVLEARGLAWLEKAFDAGAGISVRPPLGISLYALYGVERAAELTGTQQLGTHDWYREGALHLVGTQSVDGKWGGSYEVGVNAAFALLFLARATRQVPAPLSGPWANKPRPVMTMAAGLEADPASADFTSALKKLHRRDLGLNVLPQMEPVFKPSRGMSDVRAEVLVDYRRSTWWEARPHDRRRGLKITLGAPRSIDTILISGPISGPGGTAEDPNAPTSQRMIVRINGVPHPVLMPRDTRRKARLKLAEPVVLETLELLSVGELPGGESALPRLGEIEAY